MSLPLKRLGISSTPTDLDPNELRRNHEKILFAIPYCVKPVDCPVGRFNNKCLRNCLKCILSELITKLEKHGIVYYIIVRDEELLRFLEKNKSKYHYVISLTCKRAIEKYMGYAHEQLGLTGYTIQLLGETCETEKDSTQAHEGYKKGQTYINKVAVNAIIDFLK